MKDVIIVGSSEHFSSCKGDLIKIKEGFSDLYSIYTINDAQKFIKGTVWFIQDSVKRQYVKRFQSNSIVVTSYNNNHKTLKHMENILFYKTKPYSITTPEEFWAGYLGSCNFTLALCLNYAYAVGVKNIYLAGIQHPISGKMNYSSIMNKRNKQIDNSLNQLIRDYTYKFVELGVNIIQLDPNSDWQLPKKDIKELYTMKTKSWKKTKRERKHKLYRGFVKVKLNLSIKNVNILRYVSQKTNKSINSIIANILHQAIQDKKEGKTWK